MACINAFAFCVSHADCRDEEFLVRELSTVREQLSKGLKYFTDSRNKSGGSDLHLKEQVHRFVKKLSTYLELSDEISYDLLVNFLATQNADGEDDVQMFIANGRISTLLNRLRLFYWQERLSLLSLLRLAVCTWHDSWSHIADVLFAMTPFNSRDELIDYVLNEYIRTANLTENFVKEGRFGTARLTLSTGVTDFESNEEFDSVIAQDLKEQLELLNTILVGVFQDSDLTNASSRFTKILETFWSKSFGLQTPVLYSMTKHRAVINQICFTQMLILIRAAHLDSPNLFGNSNEHDLKKDRPKSAGCTKTHFLNDSRLLNRLLASLSDLGDLPVHGPLLLFGAVCATAFGLSSLESADQPLESGDAYSVDPNADNRQSVARDARVERLAEGSETFSLVVERYAGLAIESLRVFNFLNNQLDGAAQYSGSRDQEQEMLSNDSSFKEDFNMSLIDFCANVAIFDLLTLLARDVVLWSLDSDQTNNLEDTGLFGLPNRTAFIQLFSKTLRIVVRHSSLAIRPQKTPGSSSLSKLSEGSLPSNGCIGRRITRLVQALTEGFPYDLSILRLCTSLMLPSLADTKQVQKRDSTMSSLVSELVTSMPYLAERLTPELSSLISCSATPWYPQLQADGDISASNQFTLSRVRTALSVDLSRDLGLNHDVLDASGRSVYATICSGVRLPTGTRGIIKSGEC
ncbi:unnamed protein product [Calicophoron daubneyi]|uniref:Uncharacterized protein n=1 Tax=Calicophoron daubneyi TaxID=300641 RepID=A0AAV2T863_CALDB